MLLALWSARHFMRGLQRAQTEEVSSPDVTILKPMKGTDPRMFEALRSHCRQSYAGGYEIVFGVSSMDDLAVAEIVRLQSEYPALPMCVVECPQRLGTSGKVSNLVQMLRAARYEHVVINDGDISVSPNYLTNIMRGFGNPDVGLVTAPYRGITLEKGATIWAKLEALGISTDFMPGVLTARRLEGGIRFGLGSTLATTKTAIARIGGLETLTEYLADDYELGHRIAAAGYRVELCGEVVETTVPAYDFRAFWDHQIRWARSMRDSRQAGYLGLCVTYSLPWAMMTAVASGFALWSFTLFSIVLLARVSLALSVGVGLLRDRQVLRDLWLLPLRDFAALIVWMWSFADDTVVWRNERFRLRNGVLHKLSQQETEWPK